MNSKENSTALNQCVHFFTINHYIIWTIILASFHTALFKSCKYCYYKLHISCCVKMCVCKKSANK